MIRAIAFDFDGVLVESVDVKTRAFARLFHRESPEVVRRIVAYHVKNGGVSRFEKFRTIYRDILDRPLTDEEFQSLCEQFSELVVEEIVAAPWVEGAREFLLQNMDRYDFFVISGTPEQELKQIIHRRSTDGFFRDILGSPRTKEVLLKDVMERHGLRPGELVFVGDAETDWVASMRTAVPFIWRRADEHAPVLSGFAGPSIQSLVELDACLLNLPDNKSPRTSKR